MTSTRRARKQLSRSREPRRRNIRPAASCRSLALRYPRRLALARPLFALPLGPLTGNAGRTYHITPLEMWLMLACGAFRTLLKSALTQLWALCCPLLTAAKSGPCVRCSVQPGSSGLTCARCSVQPVQDSVSVAQCNQIRALCPPAAQCSQFRTMCPLLSATKSGLCAR
jgi:hypothetical protein